MPTPWSFPMGLSLNFKVERSFRLNQNDCIISECNHFTDVTIPYAFKSSFITISRKTDSALELCVSPKLQSKHFCFLKIIFLIFQISWNPIFYEIRNIIFVHRNYSIINSYGTKNNNEYFIIFSDTVQLISIITNIISYGRL